LANEEIVGVVPYPCTAHVAVRWCTAWCHCTVTCHESHCAPVPISWRSADRDELDRTA